MPTKQITAAIYARVSTADQSNDMQLYDLRRYVARQDDWASVEYVEKESSVKKRPVFERMLKDAREGKVDVILVWRIDRFARSMKDYVFTTLELFNLKVRLISVTENVDTGDENPFAEFMRGMLALLAQLERKIIVARVNAGLAEAKRKGVVLGRPRKIFHRGPAADLRDQGMSLRKIAAKLGVPLTTICRALKGYEKSVPNTPAKKGIQKTPNT